MAQLRSTRIRFTDPASEHRKQGRKIRKFVRTSGIPTTPLIEMRIADLLGHNSMVDCLDTLCEGVLAENAAANAGVTTGGDPSAPGKTKSDTPTPSRTLPKDQRAALISAIDALGKARERYRKAMNEMDAMIERLGVPPSRGLADQMKELMHRTEGVIEAALSDAKEDAQGEA